MMPQQKQPAWVTVAILGTLTGLTMMCCGAVVWLVHDLINAFAK